VVSDGHQQLGDLSMQIEKLFRKKTSRHDLRFFRMPFCKHVEGARLGKWLAGSATRGSSAIVFNRSVEKLVEKPALPSSKTKDVKSF
jgi:hypothetical protein